MKKFKDHIKAAAEQEKIKQAAIRELKLIADKIRAAEPYTMDQIQNYKTNLKKMAKLPGDSYLDETEWFGEQTVFVTIKRFFNDRYNEDELTLNLKKRNDGWYLSALFSNKYDPDTGECYPYYIK